MSEDLIEIRIPMIVTADGKYWAQGGDTSVDDPDWGFIEECISLDENPINPTRHWITCFVKRPSTVEVAGSVSS